jgi:hypothetical protein
MFLLMNLSVLLAFDVKFCVYISSKIYTDGDSEVHVHAPNSNLSASSSPFYKDLSFFSKLASKKFAEKNCQNHLRSSNYDV